MKVLSLSIICLVLSGCATLNEKECRSANWYQLGIRDGQSGDTEGLLDKHREACKKYAVQPEENQYFSGRKEGLKEYCRYNNAFRLGLDGVSYKGTCPIDVDMKFRRYNDAALEISRINRQINEVNGKIAKEERELAKADNRKDRRELAALNNKRDRLRNDLFIQQREVDRLMNEAIALQR
ncbi:MAG: DUF2799 domain-containing protein [Gallionella sp.]